MTDALEGVNVPAATARAPTDTSPDARMALKLRPISVSMKTST
jgi:hypothetical protein